MWLNLGNIPGLPLKPRKRGYIVGGGVFFWAVVGLAYFAFYLLVLGYGLIVFGVRFAVAILTTLVYLFALGVEKVRARRRD